MQDRVAFPRLYLVWPTMPAYDKDEAATDALANILGGGKSSRLYKTLVYDRQIAQDVITPITALRRSLVDFR